MNLISDIYLFSSLSFSVCYVFKSRVRNVHRSFICIYFSFIAPVGGLCCKLKYRADNSPLYFCFLFLYFFYHSSCRKDQFTVFSLKFGFQDFTDPALVNIRRTLPGLSLWFCLHKCSWNFQRSVL